jgi:hypothetical protein
MASRFSIGYLLFILAYCLTCSSAAVTSWQEEFEIKMAKMNELIESKNVQLEGKVSEKVTKYIPFSIVISSSINLFN